MGTVTAPQAESSPQLCLAAATSWSASDTVFFTLLLFTPQLSTQQRKGTMQVKEGIL